MRHLDKPILFLATANAERSRDFYQRVLGLDFGNYSGRFDLNAA
jgi:catechol 2,3-dioxygenase-like lactoylglutathione lyase family enzyme